jgi:4-amino-4-deoxy-L-arabinose transferase-like glycosyltransferase
MKWLLFFLAVKSFILGAVIWQGYIGLTPDEAQYWTWSQALDWGYYSKPPGIAWQMGLTTFLFGNTPFGVRFGAIVIGSILSIAITGVARAAGLSRGVALWSGFAFGISPLGIYLSLFATTDGGAILFLTLGALLVVQGVRQEDGPNYWLIALAVGMGALFKWTALILWPLILFSLCFFKNMRKWSVLGGIVLSLFALAPTVYWNLSHEWATFRHVGATVGHTGGGNFFDFLGAQIALFSPIFFVLLIYALFLVGRSENRGLQFAALFPILLLFFLLGAVFKKMQGNWGAYLYPLCFILLVWAGYEKMVRGKFWLKVGACLSLILVFVGLSIPALQNAGSPIPYKMSPFKHMVGWGSLAGALQTVGYRSDEHFLFGDKYQTASLLSFYAEGQKRAYFFNLGEGRKNQFSYWPQMNAKEVGKTGFFVLIENCREESLPRYIQYYQNTLAPYFKKIDCEGAYPLYQVEGKTVKYALIFKGDHYLGNMPPEKHKF